ncbi:MAG: glycosyltransferase [Bacteroidales bacterium]|nr:glycosyltransferase [Bacteroidales bacterium]
MKVIDNSLNTRRFNPKNKKDIRKKLGINRFEKIIGYIGGAPSKRGADVLVEISPKLKKLNNTGILVVGYDSDVELLKDKTKSLGTEDLFIWTGVVPYEQVVDYINCLDIGLATGMHEKIQQTGSAGQKIRQYLACGVPVICSKETNLFIENENLGELVDSKNMEDVFHAINDLLNISKTKTENMAKRALIYVHNHLSVEITTNARLEYWKQQLKDS